jgi:hypothetical protein
MPIMEPMPPRPAGRTTLTLLIACLIGAIVAPAAVYLFGSAVMGPYEGDGGLGGFASSVFSAAAQGKTGALALLLAPAGLILTWWLIFFLLRRASTDRPDDSDNS